MKWTSQKNRKKIENVSLMCLILMLLSGQTLTQIYRHYATLDIVNISQLSWAVTSWQLSGWLQDLVDHFFSFLVADSVNYRNRIKDCILGVEGNQLSIVMDIIRNGAIFAVNADAVRSPVPRFAVKGSERNSDVLSIFSNFQKNSVTDWSWQVQQATWCRHLHH